MPDTLGARVTAVLLIGLLAFHVGSLWLNQLAAESTLLFNRERQTAERVAAAKRAVAELPPSDRERMAHALSSAGLDLHWSLMATIRPSEETSPGIEAVRSRLVALLPELGGPGTRLALANDGVGGDPAQTGHVLLGALQLPDGSWLNFSAALFRPTAVEHGTLLSTTAMAIGILAVSFLVVRLIARPLRDLSDAADRIGRGTVVTPMPEAGPREVRHAAQAFNRMQARIDRIIADRTQALAAMSHDLRTPISRLRLRAAFVDDIDTQRKIDADLDEMDAMIGATLAYLRGEEEQERCRPFDLATILETVCDDAADAGHKSCYRGPTQARMTGRPVALKRAFANLVDNAVRHGGGACVKLTEGSSEWVVEVCDDGPGIPEAELDRVFEPFVRLDPARNRQTGGSGLGLTIARQIIARHQGSLTLTNRAEGGLIARVTLRQAP